MITTVGKPRFSVNTVVTCTCIYTDHITIISGTIVPNGWSSPLSTDSWGILSQDIEMIEKEDKVGLRTNTIMYKVFTSF